MNTLTYNPATRKIDVIFQGAVIGEANDFLAADRILQAAKAAAAAPAPKAKRTRKAKAPKACRCAHCVGTVEGDQIIYCPAAKEQVVIIGGQLIGWFDSMVEAIAAKNRMTTMRAEMEARSA